MSEPPKLEEQSHIHEEFLLGDQGLLIIYKAIRNKFHSFLAMIEALLE